MRKLESLIAQLDEVLERWRNEPHEVDDGEALNKKFFSIVEQLEELNDPNCIKSILTKFRDGDFSDDFNWTMLHLIEKFETQTYVKMVLDNLHELDLTAPNAAQDIVRRIYNSKIDFDYASSTINKHTVENQKAWSKHIKLSGKPIWMDQ